MARKLNIVENETQTLFDREYGVKHLKTWEMRSAHCSMERIEKIMENEKHTL
jgi:hypothetical protein